MPSQGTKRAKIQEISAEPNQQSPTHEQIVSLAHALWEQKGCPEGSADEDWFEAEKDLKMAGIEVE